MSIPKLNTIKYIKERGPQHRDGEGSFEFRATGLLPRDAIWMDVVIGRMIPTVHHVAMVAVATVRDNAFDAGHRVQPVLAARQRRCGAVDRLLTVVSLPVVVGGGTISADALVEPAPSPSTVAGVDCIELSLSVNDTIDGDTIDAVAGPLNLVLRRTDDVTTRHIIVVEDALVEARRVAVGNERRSIGGAGETDEADEDGEGKGYFCNELREHGKSSCLGFCLI